MMTIPLGEIPVAAIAILTAIFGVARLTRAIVHDDFPPSIWWRMTWSRWTKDGPWSKLFLCWWCLSFWVALFCIGWFIIGLLVTWIAWAWWIFWGGLAIGYLATMVIVRDEPND
jgi:hypothetical protein